MTRPRARPRALPDRIERGGEMVKECARVVFCFAVLALFAPVAWRSLLSGDWLGVLFAVGCAVIFPAVLAPRP